MIEEQLKRVKLTPEMRAAAAERALAYAESLVEKKEVLRGLGVLERVAKKHKGTPAATKASERRAALEKDPALAKELATQRSLDKLVGSLELPTEKFKKKERESKAEQLQALAKKLTDDAPSTAKLAGEWARVLREDWSSDH